MIEQRSDAYQLIGEAGTKQSRQKKKKKKEPIS